MAKTSGAGHDLRGFVLKESDIHENICEQKYCNAVVPAVLSKLQDTHDLLSFGDLVEREIHLYKTGDEVGQPSYGTGAVPHGKAACPDQLAALTTSACIRAGHLEVHLLALHDG